MPVNFSQRPESDALTITVAGDIDHLDVIAMRAETVRLQRETGILNFLVDLRGLVSIAGGDDLTTFRLGEEFKALNFPLKTRTAVLLPRREQARRQAEFLHLVEKNRGRGVIRYVDNMAQADAWFLQ